MSKQRADFDEWQKDVAPSTELRQWYGHDPERFDEFSSRYREELADPGRSRIMAHLSAVARHGNLTVITASKTVEISEAAVLASLLNGETPAGTVGEDSPGRPGDETPATHNSEV